MKKLRMQESARKMKNINNWYFIIKIYWKLQLYYLSPVFKCQMNYRIINNIPNLI